MRPERSIPQHVPIQTPVVQRRSLLTDGVMNLTLAAPNTFLLPVARLRRQRRRLYRRQLPCPRQPRVQPVRLIRIVMAIVRHTRLTTVAVACACSKIIIVRIAVFGWRTYAHVMASADRVKAARVQIRTATLQEVRSQSITAPILATVVQTIMSTLGAVAASPLTPVLSSSMWMVQDFV